MIKTKQPDVPLRDYLITYSFIDGSAVHYSNRIIRWERADIANVMKWVNMISAECETRNEVYMAIHAIMGLA